MNNKWDLRFLELAKHVAQWSKDPSTKVGAVIADVENRVVSVGFNGYPKDVPDINLNNREEKLAKVIHAELNAILFANRDLSNCTIYTTFVPCSQCAAAIIQSKIKRVVTTEPSPEAYARWEKSIITTHDMFSSVGAKLIYLT